MFKNRALAAALLLACVAKLSAGQGLVDFDENEFEQVHQEDLREGRSAFSWMFPKASAPSCSEGKNGICTTASLCRKYGGQRTGSCSGGGTCCDVTYKNCRDDAVCSIAVNASRVELSSTQSGIFDLRFPRLKNSDMVKLEFLEESRLTEPISQPGYPTAPDKIVPKVGQCGTESISFSGTPTINGPFVICGRLTGQHVYLAYGNQDMIMMHVNKMAGSNSVVNVRATWYSRRFRNVPQNCLQYYTGTSAIIKSFGWPEQQINDLKYTICFDDRQSTTMTVSDCPNEGNNLEPGTFSITGIRTTNPIDMDALPPFRPLLDCYRDWIQLFGENKFCNHSLPMEGLTTTTKPFRIAVHFDANEENRALKVAKDQNGDCTANPYPISCFDCSTADSFDITMCKCIEQPPAEPALPGGSELECQKLATLHRVDRYNKGFCIKAVRT